jgi:hypothetical protein
MDASQINSLFWEKLWADAEASGGFPATRPLLAHYTTMATFEAVMKNEELWLSNPLFMNDIEELRFGLLEAAKAFRDHAGIRRACGDKARFDALDAAFGQKLHLLSDDEALDTYVICFCEHDPADYNGLLSMWRGYGGNGSGAAVVLNTANLSYVADFPIVLAKVHYATREGRLKWINGKLDLFASLIEKTQLPVPMFYIAIHQLLERLKLFALFSKHDGFDEEKEWRMVYIKDRDREKRLAPMFHYHVQGDRIEPKLKFSFEKARKLGAHIQLDDIVDRIILGPSAAQFISVKTVKRMLQILDKGNLAMKVHGSNTPYRSRID